MSQISGGSVGPGPSPMDDPIPAITREQARGAAMRAAAAIGDPDELQQVLDMLGIRGLL